MNKIIDALCHCPLFAGKDKNEINNILSHTEYKISGFKKNEFIFRRDQPTIYIGIIIKGSIEVQKTLASGNVISVFHKNKGGVFGGAVAFLNKIYPCDIYAKETSEILLLHKQSIYETLCKDAIIASNILGLCADSAFQFERKIELFSYSSIKKKIAFSLLYDMESYNNDVIHLPYSKKSWAEYLNVSRPSLCRELKNLSDDGIIDIKNKIITIMNKDKLESILTN